jgi:ABC-type antimicrobial peptide transport system permease subunit
MRRASGRGTGRLLLLLLCGIIIGTIVGHILSLYIDYPIFTDTITLGTEGPFTLDLTVFTIILGFSLHVNFGTVLGVIIGLLLYFRS